MIKIGKHVMYDIVRNKVLLLYTALLLILSYTLLYFEADASKSIASLLSIVLIIVPLISVVFSSTYYYNAYEFTKLLVAQPLSRNTIIMGEYMGVACALLLAFLIGVGIPLITLNNTKSAYILLFSGAALTLSFTSLSFLISVLTREKARGIGAVLLMWLYFSILYDAMVLGIMLVFSDYPLEKIVILLTTFNPIDLARILVLMQLDISALMGFTGAVYQDFFGGNFGMIVSASVLLGWIFLPLFLAILKFRKKNI